jgi:hypothetical protein
MTRPELNNNQDTLPFLQSTLPFTDNNRQPREARIARWLTLTRVVLPGMAADCAWPVSNDHCFMRICLDTSLGTIWHTTIKRPAIRHLTDAQLEAAIAVAESVVSAPESLGALNQQSIRWRRALTPTNL